VNVFDMVGPVMIGPSSSHTAGALRIAGMARMILGERVVKADITLYESFAATCRGHGTDRAVLAGLMGMEAGDERVRTALDLARDCGLAYAFSFESHGGVHPNSADIHVVGEGGKTLSLTGASIGGGNIVIHRINGIPVAFTGELHTLIVVHRDRPGVVASVAGVLSGHGINIATMKLHRSEKGGEAIMVLETDQPMDEGVSGSILHIQGVTDAVAIRAMNVV
jgi:L-serine dehydratase